MEEDRGTRRKIIREWMALPKDKRETEEQVAAFAKKTAQQNEFHRSRRDPSRKFRRDPYQKLMGWLCPTLASRDPWREGRSRSHAFVAAMKGARMKGARNANGA